VKEANCRTGFTTRKNAALMLFSRHPTLANAARRGRIEMLARTQLEEAVAKIISLFNHKGGVSKTTTTFNLGWMLARKGKRVVIVDCDPQCNLTGMVLGFEHLENANVILGTEAQPRNIREALAPAFESRPSLIKPVECIQTPRNDRLFLLPGHIGFAEYEVTLGIAQELSGSLVTLRNLPGSLRYVIDKTAGKYEADIALVDMSPSLGAVNQNLLTTSVLNQRFV
jgi:cellulose biosynthesis protein BcsQ